MTDEQNNDLPPPDIKPGQRPVMLVPKKFVYGAIAFVVLSFAFTLFGHNPYTEAARNDFSTERSAFDGLPMWFAIFVGIPGAYWAYVNWIAPLLKRK